MLQEGAGAGPLPAETVERLRARGIRLVDAPVVEVLGDGDAVTAVWTADGQAVEVDAVFTGGTLRPHDAMVAHLDLARTDGPGPSVLAVDPTGRTSNPGSGPSATSATRWRTSPSSSAPGR